MDRKAHWETVYGTKRPDQVSWYQREATLSLTLIRRAVPDVAARIIDVGAGASTLVDGLLAAGYSHVTVLDVSRAALEQARARLVHAASKVQWIEADVLAAPLQDAAYDLWHDRAVFHFLTDVKDRAAYVAQMRRALRPRGYVLIATFAEDGPDRCSGLPVCRYSVTALHREIGDAFRLVDTVREQHLTPAGFSQSFVYGVFRLA